MWAVAAEATDTLDRSVLEDKRSASIGVATGTHGIDIGRRAQVAGAKGSMGIMAVGALHRALVDWMMERHRELRLYIGVAAIAELGLRGKQQILTDARVVHAMAADAANPGARMRRTHKVRVCIGVTAQAICVNLTRGGFFEAEDLGYVTAAFDVSKARPMAVFARQTVVAVMENHAGVRIIGKAMRNVGVASFAHCRAYVAWRQCWLRSCRGSTVATCEGRTGCNWGSFRRASSKNLRIGDRQKPK